MNEESTKKDEQAKEPAPVPERRSGEYRSGTPVDPSAGPAPAPETEED